MIERLKRQNPRKLLIMIWNFFRMSIYRLFFGRKIKASLIQNIHPTTEISVRKGHLYLKNSIFTRKNVSFRVEGGELRIGTSFFNQGCCITAMKKISIGNDCLFGPNVVIVDHDHDYHYTDNQRGNHWLEGDVVIEDNVWVGANVTILKGSCIKSGAVIGAGTVIKGLVEKDTVIITKQCHETRKIKCMSEKDKL